MWLVIRKCIIGQKRPIYSYNLNIYFIKVLNICNIKIYDYYKLLKNFFLTINFGNI